MTAESYTSEWTGMKGRIGGWYLASWLRRLSEILILGNLRKRFMGLIALRGNEAVVDAGCGSGFYSLAIAERLDSGRITCVDLSDEMLEILSRRARRRQLADRLDIRKGDVTTLDVPAGTMDLAVSNGVWHELPDPVPAARELLRVLRRGGRVVVTDFGDTTIGRRITARHRESAHGPFSVEELVRVLRDAGFADVRGERVGHWVIAGATKQ
ncbi:MAG: class I SAM-dependent methyltransferase [Acidobacteria bacterium]|nr:class I SAM-dependent methyltransferase [Acidobacteriota bacterium]